MRLSFEQERINKYYSKRAKRYNARMDATFEVSGARSTLVGMLDIQPGQRILEVGVGTGKNLKHLAPYLNNGAKFVGVDINPAMLALAKETIEDLCLAGASLATCSADYLSFSNGQFDMGFMTYALSGIPPNHAALSELGRAVKPGGTIGILDFNHNGLYFDEMPGGGFVPMNLSDLIWASDLHITDRIPVTNPRRWVSPYYQSIYILKVPEQVPCQPK